MTLVRLRGRVPGFGQLENLASGIIALERWNGEGPVSLVAGQDYIPDTILRTKIIDGQPVDLLDILPTDGTFCIRWTIAATGADHSGTPLVRFTTIPTSDEVNFADLPDVDPSTFSPLVPLPPSAQQIFDAASEAVQEAAGEATDARTARVGAETARTGAETARANAETASTAATGARDTAAQANTDAQAARTGAETARAGAETARTGAETAKTAAETARDLALAGQFAGTDLLTTDLNTVYLPGVYRQPNTASAQIARNYPVEGVSGMLVVLSRNSLGATGGRAVQQFYPQIGANLTDARLHYERASNSGGWTPWRVFHSTRVDSPTGQPGAAAYLWNDVNNVELQLAPTMINLGTTDLNTVTYPGTYLQPSTSQSTFARNYPIESVTGVLEVAPSSSVLAVVVQRFTVSGGNWGAVRGVHTRRLTGGVWGAWTFIPQQRVDNTAGRAMYTWDDTTNREQLFYGDTGWRGVTGPLLNGWTMGSYRIRRVGSLVSFVIGSLNGSAATSPQFETLPAGFQPYSTEGFTLFFEGNSPTSVYRAYVGSSGQMTTGTPIPAVNIGGTMTWLTSQAWPTTLPGTALGGVPVA